MLKNKPKIAVLLATFNGEAFLNAQLNSIRYQSGVEVFIVASDDISIDSTPQILVKACVVDCNFFVLPSKKLGYAAANFFRLLRDVDLTHIDYVALSDQDDIWHADKLAYAIEMISAKKVDAYSSNVTAFWPDGSQTIINKAQAQRQWDYMFESAGPGCTFVITKALALVLQEFLDMHQVACQPIALHDWFIYAFARSRGYQWFIDDEPHMNYRQHAGNVLGANVGVKAKLARLKKLREGWLIKQSLLIAEILGYSDAWPIQKLNRYQFFDRLALIINVSKLRRRMRDRVAFALFLLWPLRK